MRRRIIYQSLAWAPFVLVTAVTTGEIHAATQSSRFQAPKRVVQQQPLAQPPIAAPGNATRAIATTSHQLTHKTVIYEDRTTYAETPTAVETITVDKWYAQLGIPTRRKLLTAEEGSYFPPGGKPEANDQQAWYRPLELPTRRKLPVPDQQELSNPSTLIVSVDVTDAGFLTQATLRTPAKRIITDGFAYGYFTPLVAETVTVDKWYAQLNVPTRRKPPVPDQQELTPVYEAPGNANYAFTTTSSQIVNRTIVYEESAYAPYTPVAGEIITVDKWYRQLDVPTRRRVDTDYPSMVQGGVTPPDPPYILGQQLHAPLRLAGKLNYSSLAWGSVNPLVPYAWQELNYPLRLKGRLNYPALVQGNISPLVPYAWQQLDEPLRLRRLPTAGQLSYTFVAPAPGSAVAQNWFHQLDTPVRARKLYEFPYSAIPVYFVPATPGSGFEYNWWQQLDEPIRPRPSIRVASQQHITIAPRLLTTTLENAWFQELTRPTRLKLAFGQYPAVVQGNINPVVPIAWQPLDAPLRSKHRFVHEAVASAPYQIELVTMDKWWRELDRPIYTKRIDRPALTQSNVFPVVPIAWQQLHAPLRLKSRFDHSSSPRPLYPFNFAGPGNGTNQPWPALSEPVRYSPRLRPGQQQFLSYYPLLLSSDLDPACRILTPDAMYVTLAGEADTAIVPEGPTTVVADDADETVTPENQGNIITVKC